MRGLSSDFLMTASNLEQSVKIGREGSFDVVDAVHYGAQTKNERFAVIVAYLQQISRKCGKS